MSITSGVPMRALGVALFVGALSLLFISLPGFAHADDTAAVKPTATSSVSSVTTAENAYDASATTYAVWDLSTDTATYGNFTISIPAGATIDAVKVTVAGKREATGAGETARQLTLAVSANGTTFSATQTTNFGTTDSTANFTGASTKWGLPWAPSDFNNNTFKVRVGAIAATSNRDVSLGNLTVTVTYTPAFVCGTNLIANSCFETGFGAGTTTVLSGNTSNSWTADSFGTNTTSFDIVPDAHTGTHAAQIKTTAYTDGDAKWLNQTVTGISGGQYYTFSDYYKSSTSTEVDVIFTTDTGDDFQQLMLLPPSAGWTQATQGFLVPTGAHAMRIGHILQGVGTLTTDDYSLVAGTPGPLFSQGIVTLTFDDGWKSFLTNAAPTLTAHGLKATAYLNSQPIQGHFAEYMWEPDVQALANQKFDIGGHTSTHLDLTQPGVSFANEINANRAYLQTLATTSEQLGSFAYPYGAFNDAVIAAVGSGGAGYTSARTVDEGFNFTDTSKYKLKIQHVTNLTAPAQIESWIQTAVDNKVWLILMYHEVAATYPTDCKGGGEGSTADFTECSSKADLETVASYLESNHVCVQTMAQVIAGTSCVVNAAPVLNPIGNKSANASSSVALAFTATATDANAGDTLTYSATNLPAGATLSAAGAFSWKPTATQLGATTTTIVVSDGHGGTDSEAVTITVVDAAPTITLTGANPQTMLMGGSYTELGATAHDDIDGNLTSSIVINSSAVVTTTAGTYPVTYSVLDSHSNSTSTTRSVQVVDQNAPVASDQSVTTSKDVPVAVTLGATGTGSLTYTVGSPSHGALSGTAPALTYTPASGYFGSDSFTFKANDGLSESNTATVSITINLLPSCPAGYTLSGNTCTPPASVPPSACPAGFTLDSAGMCNDDAHVAPSTSACPANYTYDGTNCNPPAATPCPTGYHVEGAVCAADAPPPPPTTGGSSPSGGGGGGGGGGSTYSIKINGGDAETSSRNVTLTLHRANDNAIRVWVSNDKDFATGDWQTYGGDKEWTLAPGAGEKTVYVRFGNASSKALSTKSDTIRLTGGTVLGTSTQATPPSTGSGSGGLSAAQIASILDLLRSFGADQSVIDKVNSSLHGQAPAGPVLGASTGFLFTQTLQVGSTGMEVSELQKLLTAQGLYSGPVTGYFGPLTKAAVMAYQQKNGLPTVGIVGPQTRAKLNGK